jgi:carbonic anhydrase/acetyltransferase-like protein (isoleucine patch superfamily)
MIYAFGNKKPKIDKNTYISPNTSVIGHVELEEDTSVWFGASLRGDIEKIIIGKGSNVQDNSTIHTDYGKPCELGEYVSIGHNVVLHGCRIKDNVIVGMNSTVLDGSVVPTNCIVGAGSLVTKSSKIEEGTLILGSPAKSVRKLSEEEIKAIENNALHYIEKIKEYKIGLKEVEDER